MDNMKIPAALEQSKLPLSIDAILLLLLTPAHLFLNPHSDYWVMIILFIYLAVEFVHPMGQFSHLPDNFDKNRALFLLRLVLLFSLMTLCVIVPIFQRISERQRADAGEADFVAAYSALNDGAYQTEIALVYLAQGKNPYQESYVNTLLRRYTLPGADENPAMYYYAYLPGTLYMSLPFRAVSLPLFGFFDQRIVFMSLYIVMVLLLPLLAVSPERKLALLVGAGLNPYFTDSIVHGMNDIIVVLFLVLTVLSLQRKHILWATFWFTLACSTKQTAWLVGPFYLVALWQLISKEQLVKQLGKVTAVLLTISLLLIGPFLLWDFSSFVQSTLLYAGGALEQANYPITGYNLGWFLLLTGIIDSPQANFPFWVLQLGVGLPVLFILLRQQFIRGQLNRMLLNASLFIVVFGFLSRFFQGNYVAFVVTLLVIGTFMQPVTLINRMKPT